MIEDYTGHTPGPWKAVGNQIETPLHGDSGPSIIIARTAGNSDEALDNARLIAAAPTLLAEAARWQAIAEGLAGAVTEARDALHFHYVEWDGEPEEDAVPLHLARAKCNRALATYTAARETPND